MKQCEKNVKPQWDCPNIKPAYEGFDGERYRCDKCGYSYFLDYGDMK